MPVIARRLLIALLVVALGTVAVVVLTRGEDKPEPKPQVVKPLSLRDVDTTVLPVQREDFCADIPGEAVALVLGTEDFTGSAYADGDKAQVFPGLTDISHEYGCTFYAKAKKRTARAWVFAPPVSNDRARAVIKATVQAKGCQKIPKAPKFGKPSLALLCGSEKAPEISFRGLFGDAWLTCTIKPHQPPATKGVLQSAENWCLAVAQAAKP